MMKKDFIDSISNNTYCNLLHTHCDGIYLIGAKVIPNVTNNIYLEKKMK
jgi:hypothetical protein